MADTLDSFSEQIQSVAELETEREKNRVERKLVLQRFSDLKKGYGEEKLFELLGGRGFGRNTIESWLNNSDPAMWPTPNHCREIGRVLGNLLLDMPKGQRAPKKMSKKSPIKVDVVRTERPTTIDGWGKFLVEYYGTRGKPFTAAEAGGLDPATIKELVNKGWIESGGSKHMPDYHVTPQALKQFSEQSPEISRK